MENRRNQPLGIELVRRGIVTESEISRALENQKTHPDKRIGDILFDEKLGDPNELINAMSELLDEKFIILNMEDVKVTISDYLPIDNVKKNRAIPFEVGGGKIKVCFSSMVNHRMLESMRLLFLNKGLIMERYLTFESCIQRIINALDQESSDTIDVNGDVSELVNSIIKQAMEQRASDIHIEPEEKQIRVRYRIDGELVTAAIIEKEKQEQLIGRLKAISNMHQEKQDDQDGKILLYDNYNIRASSQRNIYGEKFVLRLLKKNSNVQQIFELGFPNDPELVKKCFNKKNSIVLVAAPTGEGKTTTLYSIIDFLNKPQINVTTIEDPVEIRIPGLNQIEISAKSTFSGALRTVLRQDPDIVLVGEIRDKETAEIAMQAGQTGHYVLSTIHTIDSIEVITRLRKIGVSNYDIGSTLATSLSQRLVRRVCPHCAVKRPFNDQEKEIINNIAKKYDMEYDFTDKFTYDVVGCDKCNKSGYYGRIGCFEILNITDEIKELIIENKSSIEIRKEAIKQGYRPLLIDGFNKVVNGYTTLDELNSKLVFY